MRMMKSKGKIVAFLMTALITLTVIMPLTNVFAAEETGKLYYQIKLNSNSTLNVGDIIFLSNDENLEDYDFMSLDFPSEVVSAELKITSDLENATYGPTGVQGYKVDVIQRDTAFDTCNDGHIFYENGFWKYYCNYGGAQNKGPYAIYNVGTLLFTAKDVEIKVVNQSTEDVVLADELEITIHTEQGSYTVKESEFSFIDKDYDVNKGDYDLTINLGGITVTTFATEEVISEIDDLKNLSEDEKNDFKNQITNATSNEEIKTILENAKNKEQSNLEEEANKFIKDYLSDDKGNIYQEVNSKNVDQILSGADIYDNLSEEVRNLIDSIIDEKTMLYTCYEDYIDDIVEFLTDSALDFLDDYLTDKEGNIYTTATKDNYEQILSGKDEWDQLSQAEKDVINEVLRLNEGKTYEELLELATQLKEQEEIAKEEQEDEGDVLGSQEETNKDVVKKPSGKVQTSDNTNAMSYLMFMGVSAVFILLSKKKKQLN